MLKKGKTFEIDKEPEPSKITEQKNFSIPPSPETKDEKTVIGEHIFIEGNIRGDEHLVIEGSMNGNIEMGKHNFALGSKGRYEGEILAQNVSISGQISGSVKAQGKVEITKEADFLGDIKAKSISVEDGAYFSGSIELKREPHRKTALTEKPTGMAVSPSDKASVAQSDKANKKI
jgi:cytoskeletal protein CcmA (bactofilin family)